MYGISPLLPQPLKLKKVPFLGDFLVVMGRSGKRQADGVHEALQGFVGTTEGSVVVLGVVKGVDGAGPGPLGGAPVHANWA